MRKGLILLLIAASGAACAQPIPSKEAFLNEVISSMIDSAAPKYYLSREAYPCGFIKYDYDEWFKYNLKEDVPIYILNELAEKCYHDQRHTAWRQDSLVKGVCVTPAKSDSIVNPFAHLGWDKMTRRQRRGVRRQIDAWLKLPGDERIVYDLSKPEFTDDGQYAVIDEVHDCGKECSAGYTYLFRRTGPTTWKLIGRSLNWQS